MQKLPYSKTKFCIYILQTFIWCFVFSLLVQAQTEISKNLAISAPISTCELLKNKKKYDKKEIQVKAVWEIQAETSFLHIEDNCEGYEGITAGEDNSFKSINSKTVLENYLL